MEIDKTKVALLVESVSESVYREVLVPTWEHFDSFVELLQEMWGPYVYRGHASGKWKLVSSFDRSPSELTEVERVSLEQTRDNRLTEHLERFKHESSGRRGSNAPELSDDQWWALGQHYGLTTPLLDWTASSRIGLFFAFERDMSRNDVVNRAVFALKREALNIHDSYWNDIQVAGRHAFSELDKDDTHSQLMRAMFNIAGRMKKEAITVIDPVTNENQRMLAQLGVSAKCKSALPVEEWVKRNFAIMLHNPVLIKIIIPNRDRDECLKHLNQMNINHSSLFPDLYGASEYCNLARSIPGYSKVVLPGST